MKPEKLIISILFLACSIGVAYIFYVKNRVDTLHDDLTLTRDELKLCESDKKILRNTDNQLRFEIKEAQLETKFKIKEIESLNRVLEEKDNRLNDLDIEIQRKEERIKEMFEELREIVSEGATTEVREKLASLYTEMDQLRSEKSILQNEKKQMQDVIRSVRLELREKEREIAMLQEVEIPKLTNEVNDLKNELAIAQQFQAFANIRAEIENVKIDNKKDILQFDLKFEPEEVNYLRNNELLKKLTFSPKIINDSESAVFMPDITSFDVFTKQRHELAELITITFPVSNFKFRKYKNGKKGVNLRQGDLIKVKVVLEELQDLEIANKSFYLK